MPAKNRCAENEELQSAAGRRCNLAAHCGLDARACQFKPPSKGPVTGSFAPVFMSFKDATELATYLSRLSSQAVRE